MEGFVEEAPRKELLFALKQLLWESLTDNFNSNLDNSIKDYITLIVFLIEGFVRFKAHKEAWGSFTDKF